MAIRNPLQEQLLKAGLAKKSKIAEAARQQERQRQGKGGPVTEDAVDGRRLQAERAERDRALAAERNAQLRAAELQAQIRQIIDSHKLPRDGEIAYRFIDDGAVRQVLVNPALRSQLAKGAVVIVRHGDAYELIPRAAAEMILARNGSLVVDHGRTADSAPGGDEDPDAAYYAQFQVPDDLIW